MALSLTEMKELLSFGKELGLHHLKYGELEAVFGPTPKQHTAEEETADDEDDLRRYSATGRAAMREGKTA